MYSASDNLTLPISWVLIGQHLNFCSLTSPMCCDSPWKCMPVKYKVRQKAKFPIVTETPSLHEQKDKNLKNILRTKTAFLVKWKVFFILLKGF